jgi:hypothetical protein
MEPGFYWSKIKGFGLWTVAEYVDGKWWVIGSKDEWRLDELEVGQRLATPSP